MLFSDWLSFIISCSLLEPLSSLNSSIVAAFCGLDQTVGTFPHKREWPPAINLLFPLLLPPLSSSSSFILLLLLYPPPPPHWLHFSLSPSLLLSSLHPVAFLPLLLLLLTAGDAPGCSEASRHVYDFPAGRRVEWEADGLSSCNRNMQIGFLSSLKVWQVALNYRKTLTLNWILFFQLTNEFGMLGDAGGCWGMLETFLR